MCTELCFVSCFEYVCSGVPQFRIDKFHGCRANFKPPCDGFWPYQKMSRVRAVRTCHGPKTGHFIRRHISVHWALWEETSSGPLAGGRPRPHARAPDPTRAHTTRRRGRTHGRDRRAATSRDPARAVPRDRPHATRRDTPERAPPGPPDCARPVPPGPSDPFSFL